MDDDPQKAAYHDEAAVLISVGVVGLESAAQIANTVLRMITDRVT